jgi:predicted DsbA family dithiol-disulfide isomerase
MGGSATMAGLMNASILPLVPYAPRLTLDVVADFTCPWSFLGLRRIVRALGNVQGLSLPPLLRWHGFRLPRDASAEARAAWRAHLATRLPPGMTPQFAEQSLEEAGRELGIRFDFARIAGAPDTAEAHRLMVLAAREGRQVALADAIFRAYFEDGRDIGDRAELQRAGREAGLSEAALQAFEDATQEGKAVVDEEQRLRALGVENVPNLLLNGRVLVPGPADVDTYVQALDQAMFPGTPPAAAHPRLLN